MTSGEIIRQEAKRLLAGIVALVFIVSGFFFLAGRGDFRTLASLWGGAVYSFCLFLMIGANASRAVLYPPATAIKLVRRGYVFRYLLTGVLVILAMKLSFINAFAAILPLFFPKVILLGSSVFRRKGG